MTQYDVVSYGNLLKLTMDRHLGRNERDILADKGGLKGDEHSVKGTKRNRNQDFRSTIAGAILGERIVDSTSVFLSSIFLDTIVTAFCQSLIFRPCAKSSSNQCGWV